MQYITNCDIFKKFFTIFYKFMNYIIRLLSADCKSRSEGIIFVSFFGIMC